jgi:hypothetical protein
VADWNSSNLHFRKKLERECRRNLNHDQ